MYPLNDRFMKKTEISKFDYKTHKEMLEDYIGKNIVYNEDDYQLLNFKEYHNQILLNHYI